MSAITVYDLAVHRLREQGLIAPDGEVESLSGADFDRVGLPMTGGCEVCGASVAAYNSCPSKTGFIRCENGCVGELGYETVEEANEEANEALFGSDA
jgi:hypothetical protein